MIVSSVENGWELIFQPAHGLLAAKIANQFDEANQSALWYETVTAINVHDDFKGDADGEGDQYVTDAGAPRDFTLIDLDADQRFVQAEKKLANSYRKHQWAGLLESTHMEFLYGTEEVSKEMSKLLDREADRRSRTLKELNRSTQELQHAYDLMRWCDRCSLILCQQQLPAMERKLEINQIRDTEHVIWQRDDETIGVEPWPFGSDEFVVGVEVYQIEQLSFVNDNALFKTVDSTVPVSREWTFMS